MILALLGLFSCPAFAQATCDQRLNIIGRLSGSYAETPKAMGIADNGGVVELLTSTDGATWTFVITFPNGVSCLISSGRHWETLPPENKDPKS